jgi:hypothetical protein
MKIATRACNSGYKLVNRQKEKTMKEKNKVLRTGLMVTLLLGALGLSLLAQQDHGKKGFIRIESEALAGELLLPQGTYQVRCVDGVVIFNKMKGLRGSVFTRVGEEVGRVACQIEPLGNKMEHTEMLMSTDPAGNNTITELRIKGENVRHLF